jgi:hypothetical protein
VTAGESQKFGGEILEPRRRRWKPHRAAGEQIALGEQAITLVGVRGILGDIERTLFQTLDKALADRRAPSFLVSLSKGPGLFLLASLFLSVISFWRNLSKPLIPLGDCPVRA